MVDDATEQVPDPRTGRDQREEVRAAARMERTRAQLTKAQAIRSRQQVRAVADLVGREHSAGNTGDDAFLTLPVPAVLLDQGGRIVQVNPAWQSLPGIGAHFGIGTYLGPGWTALTEHRFIEKSLADVITTGIPMQMETTSQDEPRRRLLVHIGPAALASGPGALVVLIDITPQYEREQRQLYQATHDPLTGIANRAWLAPAVEQALGRYRRYGEKFALIYLDLDGFKAVNDHYGHLIGDGLLREVATRWNALVRDPDLLARVGGDEFIVLVNHVGSLAQVDTLLRRLTDTLAEPVTVAGRTIQLSVSAGVAAPLADTTAEDVIALADRDMYLHKHGQAEDTRGSRGSS